MPQHPIGSTTMDFVKMRFCNSKGFYVIGDIVGVVYDHVPGPVVVRRDSKDEWAHETLPIILKLNEEDIAARTTFEDVEVPWQPEVEVARTSLAHP